MFKKLTTTLAIAACSASVLTVLPTSAIAQSSYHHRHHRDYQDDDRYYHSDASRSDNDNRHCGSGNGAVGTVAGGAGGAVLGNVLGGGTLGTVAGGIGGALLGRHFDKQHTRDRNSDRNGC